MTIEENRALAHHMELTPGERYLLALLGQQRALSLDQLPRFLRLLEGRANTEPLEPLKSRGHKTLERLQRAGLVTIHQFDGGSSWVWLAKGGRHALGITSSSHKELSRASLPILQAANALRLLLSEQYPHGAWISRQQLRQDAARQKHPPHPTLPTAEFATGEGDYLALHVLLRDAGSEERLVKSIRQQLEREGHAGQPYYSALWYYATPNVAVHVREAFAQVSQKCDGAASRLRIFSYPLVPNVMVYQGHHASIGHLAWSPDGAGIVSTDEDLTLHVWSAQTGALLFPKSMLASPASTLAWSPDRTRIALTTEEGLLSILDARTGEQVFSTAVHTDLVTGMAWAPQHADRLATCSTDGSIQILDLRQNALLWTRDHGSEQRASALAWSPDGTRLAIGSNDTQVRLFDATTGQQLFTYRKHPHLISALAWSPDSTLLASASDNLDVHIWEARSGRRVRSLWSGVGMVYRMGWSADGTRLAWIGDEERVVVYNPRTGKRLFVYDDHARAVNALAWSPDGTRLASGGDDTTVHVYSVTGGAS